MTPVVQALTIKAGIKECKTAHMGWWQWWKQCSRPRAADGYTHASFMDMLFVCSVEQAALEATLSELISRLRAVDSALTARSLSLWCGRDNLSDDWFASNQEY